MNTVLLKLIRLNENGKFRKTEQITSIHTITADGLSLRL